MLVQGLRSLMGRVAPRCPIMDRISLAGGPVARSTATTAAAPATPAVRRRPWTGRMR